MNLKGEINSNTIIVGDLNNPLTPVDRLMKKKFSQETEHTQTIEQMDLSDIYRAFHSTENTVFQN